MKGKLLKGALLALAGVGLACSNALAYPWDTLSSDYEVSTSMDYWTPTDFTTNITGTSLFQLEVELAAYESAFGLYTIDQNADLALKFEIFSYDAEPLTKSTITFWDDNGTFKITDSFTADEDFTNDGWMVFDSTFGFYYDVYGTDTTRDYSFYTDSRLNSQDVGIEHIKTAYSADQKNVYIYLEDLLATNADWDWQDMTVFADDVKPVPEPATMLLFGTGVAGLAGMVSRRKAKK